MLNVIWGGQRKKKGGLSQPTRETRKKKKKKTTLSSSIASKFVRRLDSSSVGWVWCSSLQQRVQPFLPDFQYPLDVSTSKRLPYCSSCSYCRSSPSSFSSSSRGLLVDVLFPFVYLFYQQSGGARAPGRLLPLSFLSLFLSVQKPYEAWITRRIEPKKVCNASCTYTQTDRHKQRDIRSLL